MFPGGGDKLAGKTHRIGDLGTIPQGFTMLAGICPGGVGCGLGAGAPGTLCRIRPPPWKALLASGVYGPWSMGLWGGGDVCWWAGWPKVVLQASSVISVMAGSVLMAMPLVWLPLW